METKTEIIGLLKSVNRTGMEEVIKHLEESDFFDCPASTRNEFHNCFQGGLAKHSLDVYKTMRQLNESYELHFNESSLIIVGLLHDICKVHQYIPNVLSNGKLSDKIPYKISDSFPIGHGEKSVIVLLQLGLQMSNEEMLGIRWHMNAYDDIGYYKTSAKFNNLSILCFIADYFSSTFMKD